MFRKNPNQILSRVLIRDFYPDLSCASTIFYHAQKYSEHIVWYQQNRLSAFSRKLIACKFSLKKRKSIVSTIPAKAEIPDLGKSLGSVLGWNLWYVLYQKDQIRCTFSRRWLGEDLWTFWNWFSLKILKRLRFFGRENRHRVGLKK